MPGELSLPIQEYPDYYKTVIVQLPGVLVGASRFITFTDQDIIIDAAGIWVDVLPTTPTPLKTVQLGYYVDGDSIVSGGVFHMISSDQVLLTSLVARTMIPLVIDRTQNLIPAYSTIVWRSTVEIPETDGSGNMLWVRYRTVQN